MRRLSRETGTSLNKLAVDLLNAGTGSGADAVRFHDLDDLVGSWVADPVFDQAIESFDAIDSALWK